MPMRRTDGSWPNGSGLFVTPGRRLNWWCGPSDDDWQNLTAPTVTSPRNSGNEDYLFDAFIRGGFGVATRLWGNSTTPQLRFAPYADGVFDAVIRVGNDFRVMQDYVACSVTVADDCPQPEVVNVLD